MGFLKFMLVNYEFFTNLLKSIENSIEEDIKFEWKKLDFWTEKRKILFFNKSKPGLDSPQLNVNFQTSVKDQNELVTLMLNLVKAIYLSFPNYDRYFIGYEHNRSPSSFIRVCKEDIVNALSATNHEQKQNSILSNAIVKQQDGMIWDIRKEEVDERAYKFHSFPKIRDTNWVVQKIEDCSIEKYKRLKARLIIEGKVSKNEVKTIVEKVIKKVKPLNTPKNPRENVPYGNRSASVVLLDVFYKSNQRGTFTLFPNNKYFICMAHYYATPHIPKIEHGSIHESIWNQLEKESIKKIAFAWNPSSTA